MTVTEDTRQLIKTLLVYSAVVPDSDIFYEMIHICE